jgi:hypothetical protein
MLNLRFNRSQPLGCIVLSITDAQGRWMYAKFPRIFAVEFREESTPGPSLQHFRNFSAARPRYAPHRQKTPCSRYTRACGHSGGDPADVYDHPVELLEAEEGWAFGAALLAGTGVGAWPSVEAACEATIRAAETIHPQNAAVMAEAPTPLPPPLPRPETNLSRDSVPFRCGFQK